MDKFTGTWNSFVYLDMMIQTCSDQDFGNTMKTISITQSKHSDYLTITTMDEDNPGSKLEFLVPKSILKELRKFAKSE